MSEAEKTAFLAPHPEVLHPHLLPALTKGAHEDVLHYLETASRATELGADETATFALDRALERIEAVYADNEAAARARSTFTAEDYKDFRGEPYERMMAYYYRGLHDLMRGDYQNARAAYRAGHLQDSLAGSETYRQDVAAMAYLEGWASHCAGDDQLAETAFAEAVSLNEALTVPGPEDRVLLLAETGLAPRKEAAGTHNQFLIIRRGYPTAERTVRFRQGETVIDAVELEDVYFQASTRGGREIEAILDGQAILKEGLDQTGDVLMTAGVFGASAGSSNNNSDAALIGGAAILIGLGVKLVSDAVTPDADTRAWQSLPEKLHVAVAPIGAVDPTRPVTVEYLRHNGETIERMTRTLSAHGDETCSVYRNKSANALLPAQHRAYAESLAETPRKETPQ